MNRPVEYGPPSIMVRLNVLATTAAMGLHVEPVRQVRCRFPLDWTAHHNAGAMSLGCWRSGLLGNF